MSAAAPGTLDAGVRRRVSGAERRRLIVESAAAQFAEAGFVTTTRALAEAMGVTQALLYRYFASKEALIDAVFRTYFLNAEVRGDRGLLAAREVPLAERLGAFYASLFERMDETRLRLFLRAALDELPLPARYASRLDQNVLFPVLDELRCESGLPDLAARAPRVGERELAMLIHGAAIFLAIRKYIYRIRLQAPVGALLALQARVFVPGAVAELRRLQTLADDDPLAAPVRRISEAP